MLLSCGAMKMFSVALVPGATCENFATETPLVLGRCSCCRSPFLSSFSLRYPKSCL